MQEEEEHDDVRVLWDCPSHFVDKLQFAVVVFFALIETSTKAKCCGLQECNLILRQWWRSSWNDRVIFLRIILPRILPPSPPPYDCLVCHNV